MRITLFLILTLSAVTFPKAGPIDPPSLSMMEAAAIAQKKLDELKLPPEYFLRAISYHPSSKKEPAARYTAFYEPPFSRSTEEPIKIKFIKISMDGTASLEEREFGPSKPMASVTHDAPTSE